MDLYRAKEYKGGEEWLIGSVLQVSDQEMYMFLAGPIEIEIPEYNANAIGCGIEDRFITDVYEAAEYGWNEACEMFESVCCPEFVKLQPEAVCKSTGFYVCKDHSGELIFEKDILSFTVFDHEGRDTQYTGVVKFAMGEWKIWHDNESEYYGSDGAFSLFWVLNQDDEVEIIGNVFDIPEALRI